MTDSSKNKKNPTFLRGKKIYWIMGLLITFGVITVYIVQPKIFKTVDNAIYDYYARLFKPLKKSNKTVVIDIDEKALLHYGQWPWPRYILGTLMNTLHNHYHVGAIGIDILMAEKDRTSLSFIKKEFSSNFKKNFRIQGLPKKYYDNDKIFAQALKNTPSVLGYFFTFFSEENNKMGHFAQTYAQCPLRQEDISVFYTNLEAAQNTNFAQTATGVICPLKPLLKSANTHAFYNALPDFDGVIRRSPLVIRWNNHLYPSLALAAYMTTHHIQEFSLSVDENGTQGIQVGEVFVPTDAFGYLTLTFKGGPKTFPHYSAADILEKKIPVNALKGKTTFLGSSATGLKDIRTTPFGSNYPGIEIHSVIVDNLETQTFTHMPSWVPGMQVSLQALIGLITVAALTWSPSAAMFIFLFLFLGSIISSTSLLLFISDRIFVSPLYLGIIFIANLLSISLIRFWREENHKKFLRQAFGHYLSPTVISQIENNPDGINLNGEEKPISAFFSDVRGFTTPFRKIVTRSGCDTS